MSTAAIRAEFLDKLIDQARIDQWFIALNVNDERELFRVACDFGYRDRFRCGGLAKSGRPRLPN